MFSRVCCGATNCHKMLDGDYEIKINKRGEILFFSLSVFSLKKVVDMTFNAENIYPKGRCK